jgi:large subunit ribosomal protein L32e
MIKMPEDSETTQKVGEKSKATVSKPAPAKKVKKAGTSKSVKAKAKKVSKKADKEKKDAKDLDDEDDVEIVEDEEEDDEAEAEAVYVAKQKPKLTKAEKRLLSVRSNRKKQQPTFKRQEWFRYKKLGEAWRKPRGLHSKMRVNKKYRQNMARIGYGTNAKVRNRHPSGFEEVLVYRPGDLEGLDPKKQAARIGHQVGTRKRIAIEDRADELGIRILNRGSV